MKKLLLASLLVSCVLPQNVQSESLIDRLKAFVEVIDEKVVKNNRIEYFIKIKPQLDELNEQRDLLRKESSRYHLDDADAFFFCPIILGFMLFAGAGNALARLEENHYKTRLAKFGDVLCFLGLGSSGGALVGFGCWAFYHSFWIKPRMSKKIGIEIDVVSQKIDYLHNVAPSLNK